jgi:hypothetical protein
VTSSYLEKRRVTNLRKVFLRKRRTIFTPLRHRLVLGRCLLPSSPFSAYRVFVRSSSPIFWHGLEQSDTNVLS